MSARSSKRCRPVPPALVLAILAALGACSDGGSIGPQVAESRVGVSDLKSYRIGVGDKVRVIVFGEPDLSGTFEVNAQGRIALPLAGDIQVVGLDINGVREAAVRRLSDGYLKAPRVTAEVAGYRPIYVHGEVRTSGEFPYKVGLRLRDAIALAGGYTYRANQSYVLLARDGSARDLRVGMPTDMLVMPGDNIRVPERYF
jgi:polysaccharide export outer membrane protein